MSSCKFSVNDPDDELPSNPRPYLIFTGSLAVDSMTFKNTIKCQRQTLRTEFAFDDLVYAKFYIWLSVRHYQLRSSSAADQHGTLNTSLIPRPGLSCRLKVLHGDVVSAFQLWLNCEGSAYFTFYCYHRRHSDQWGEVRWYGPFLNIGDLVWRAFVIKNRDIYALSNIWLCGW